jgi:hypothetical protein
MQVQEKHDFIKRKAKEHIPETSEKIAWSVHAVKKLRLDGLKKNDVEISLRECEIIEDYSMKGRSLPGCLVLSFITSDPIHAVIAIDKAYDRIFIVTVYKPSSARWQNDWKTRRRK